MYLFNVHCTIFLNKISGWDKYKLSTFAYSYITYRCRYAFILLILFRILGSLLHWSILTRLTSLLLLLTKNIGAFYLAKGLSEIQCRHICKGAFVGMNSPEENFHHPYLYLSTDSPLSKYKHLRRESRCCLYLCTQTYKSIHKRTPTHNT